MSTFEAVGPAFALDGPPPVAPPHSLLETPGVVVERDATRVLNGVNVWSYPTGCSEKWEVCSDGTYRVKDDDSEMLTPRFDSFVAYKPVTCSSIGFSNDAAGVLFDKAEATLDATISAAVESALAAGVDTNPFFGDATVDVLNSGTKVSPGIALSFLEEAIGETCRLGMLHFTPAVVSALQAFPIGDANDTRLITANGTPVVSGMGYQDIDTPYLSTPGATSDWAFATGPVKVYLGPIRLDQVKENIDQSLNIITFRAERYVLAIWDTALQAAVLVDWAT